MDLKTGGETANQDKHRQEKELMLAQPPDLQSSWQSSHRAVAGADAAGASAGAAPSRVYLKTFCAHTGKSSLNREAPISAPTYRMACIKGGSRIACKAPCLGPYWRGSRVQANTQKLAIYGHALRNSLLMNTQLNSQHNTPRTILQRAGEIARPKLRKKDKSNESKVKAPKCRSSM